jgi:hypothetical protein
MVNSSGIQSLRKTPSLHCFKPGKLLLAACFFCVTFMAKSQPVIDSLFRELNIAIENRENFASTKSTRISNLKGALPGASREKKYFLYSSIYEEYKSFIYDSAFLYARKLREAAIDLNDPLKLSQSRLKIAFVLVSSGLFSEALDTLQSIRSRSLPDSLKVKYYDLMARTFYDLTDFSNDSYFGTQYGERASNYIDSAMVFLDENDVEFHLFTGLKALHMQNMAKAKEAYQMMIDKFKLSPQQFAVVASTLSFIYYFSGDPVKAKEMLIRAAIADIRACTKETLATMKLAELLYQEGDVENAYNYIKIASEDAKYYGARQRKVQVAAIYPVIEGKQLSMIESKRKTLLIYSSLITLLTLSVIGFSLVIYKQNKKLQKARRIISKANESLTDKNHQLQDANKIKEEYIWYYFNTTAEYITKLDALKKTLELKLMTKKLEDLRFTVDSINIKRERDELYHNFDKVFLKLFPDFVTVFNSLFKDEDKIVPKDGQLLNTELRIFALYRMGIHDHERIAKILDYSVTTIYTYKTRIRNKSILPNEAFDKQIMSIRAI